MSTHALGSDGGALPSSARPPFLCLIWALWALGLKLRFSVVFHTLAIYSYPYSRYQTLDSQGLSCHAWEFTPFKRFLQRSSAALL